MKAAKVREEFMAYGLFISFFLALMVFVYIALNLASKVFPHEGLGVRPLLIRVYFSLEFLLLGLLSIAFRKPFYAGLSFLLLVLFNPMWPVRHITFWWWQAVDWPALLFICFCNLTFFGITQQIATESNKGIDFER